MQAWRALGLNEWSGYISLLKRFACVSSFFIRNISHFWSTTRLSFGSRFSLAVTHKYGSFPAVTTVIRSWSASSLQLNHTRARSTEMTVLRSVLVPILVLATILAFSPAWANYRMREMQQGFYWITLHTASVNAPVMSEIYNDRTGGQIHP